ncbi:MAG TPA: glycosyltransferase family 2 protein [Thermoanaerobaculia bacterium]|nr:glycosyltransferase family 2 protein [Thermoanaerobaculia bacterium]
MLRLSIVVPAYNERNTVRELLARVAAAPLPEGVEREVVVVDDGSSDGTRELLAELEQAADPLPFRLVLHERNQGKGAAVRSGLTAGTGDVLLIQDADLEYDPRDYPRLLQPILEGEADVVFGSRFLGGPHRVLFFWHSLGNRFLTTLSNMLTDLNLSDMETCYKVFRREMLEGVELRSNRFGIEPELTARMARRGARIYEVPISYRGRTYAEGKKIGWRDGVAAIWAILRYNLFS